MRFVFLTWLLLGALSAPFFGQNPEPSQNATCTFDDAKEISLRYNNAATGRNELETGKPLMPGGSPILLFTQGNITAAGSAIPAGAYSVYVIPEKKDKWTLTINKNVSNPASYDPAQDLARLPMDVGKVKSDMKSLTVALVHIAPKQCNVRVYYGNQMASWAGFQEQAGTADKTSAAKK